MGKITTLTFLDIETTAKEGPDSWKDSIVEVAATRIRLEDRQVLDRWDSLIKPWGDQAGRPFATAKDAGPLAWELGEYHTKPGTFRGVDWDNALDYGVVLDILRDRFLTEGATIAGWNPGFDIGHIKRDFFGAGRAWPKLDYHVIDLCPAALFLVMSGHVESVSLRNVGPWAGCPDQIHRAGPDVDNTIAVFWAMHDFYIHGRKPDFSRDLIEPEHCL